MPAERNRIYHLLQIAAHRMRVRADREALAAASISAAQAGVLFVIEATPGITQRRLAQALRLGEPAVTAIVGRLLEARLVARRRSDADARAVALVLTSDGSAALAAVRPALARMNAALAEAIGEERLSALAADLEAIAALPLPAGDPIVNHLVTTPHKNSSTPRR